MNSLFIPSLILTVMIISITLYMLDKLKKGYGTNIPPYFTSPFIDPKKATEGHKFHLLVEVIAGFICSIFGIILVVISART